MHSDKAILVIVLIIGIVVISNLAMFAMAHRSRNTNIDWLKSVRNTFTQPFKSEEDSLKELRQRVDDLQSSHEDTQEGKLDEF